jgi:hypothetical protein
MQNSWVRIADGYSISSRGQIRHDLTERPLKRSYSKLGEPYVSFRIDGHLIRRQVISYMAEFWMEPHPNELFDTPMHLDGDRHNCHVSNLIFRPRWFVIAFNKEVQEDRWPSWEKRFRIRETGEVFQNPYECSKCYGFLQNDIYNALFYPNSHHIFPGAFTAEFID